MGHVSQQSVHIGRMVADEIGRAGGFAVRPDAWIPFAVQAQRETGGVVTSNNPLNLTDPGHGFLWRGFGQMGHRAGGTTEEWHTDFAAFDSLEGGSRAAAANYLGGLYGGVIDSLRRGAHPVELAGEIERSPWDSGRYHGTLDEEVREHYAQLAGADVSAPLPDAPSSVRVTALGGVERSVAGAQSAVQTAVADKVSAIGDAAATKLVVLLLVALAVVLLLGVL